MDFVFVDFARSRRGGQVYMERLAASLRNRGEVCRLHLRGRKGRVGLYEFFVQAIRYICVCKGWIVGTAPAFLPVFLIARYPVLLIQSPISEWSWKARMLLKVALRIRREMVICVSDYVRDELSERYDAQSLVVYAQIDTRGMDYDNELTYRRNDKKFALALLYPREFGKGYLSSVSLIEKACREMEVVVDVYGEVKGELMEIEKYCKVVLHGFVEEPFEDFASRRRECKRAYLGMSHFEGLHMAVVEAGQRNIPSILSDIPAHRELERLVDQQVMIGRTHSEYFALMNKMAEDDAYYEEMMIRYRHMSEMFLRKGEQQVNSLLKLMEQLEAEAKRKWN